MRRAVPILLVALACGDNHPAPPDAATDTEVARFPAVQNRSLDVLLMIDDSPGAIEYETNFKRAFPELRRVLETVDGGLPDLHIGVVTSDLGATGSSAPGNPGPGIGSGPGACNGLGKDGALQTFGAAINGSFLVDIANPDGTRTTNFAGTLEDAVSAIASTGGNGCGFEQHLRAFQRGLTNPLNTGFVRAEANLGVILLGDEDDCSMKDASLLGSDTQTLGPLQSFRCTRFGVTCDQNLLDFGDKTGCHPLAGSPYIDDVQPFDDFLLGFKRDPRMVMAAAIVGPPTPFATEPRSPPGGGTPVPALAHSCNWVIQDSSLEVADPAVRDAAFIYGLQDPSLLLSICASDLTPQLTQVGRALKKLIGETCIDTTGLLDSSPDPGVQPICTAEDVRDSAPSTPTALAACPSDGDCVEVVADPQACWYVPDHLRVVVHRTTPAAPDTWTHVRCRIAP